MVYIGQYLRTLRPASHDLSFTVELVSVGYQGHLVFTGHNSESHSLHVFTLNGRHIGSVNLAHRVTGDNSLFLDIYIFLENKMYYC